MGSSPTGEILTDQVARAGTALDQFRDRHLATDIVVVADAGMLSAVNLDRLEDAGFSFVVASRTSSAPYDLAEHYATVGNITIDAARKNSIIGTQQDGSRGSGRPSMSTRRQRWTAACPSPTTAGEGSVR